MLDIPRAWRRAGLMLARNDDGPSSLVVGDPCIVRDETIGGYRMFLFALPPGHGQAVCAGGDPTQAASWRWEGPLLFSNPEAMLGESVYKPFVICDPYRPNLPVRIGGAYALLLVTNLQAKFVQRAWAESLTGPWRLEERALIERGEPGDFDAKHLDAVSGYYFPEREEILYFYMGLPSSAQPWERSPYGSAQGAAVEKVSAAGAAGGLRKLGPLLPPDSRHGHWASGWVGGMQILPGRKHRWIAIANASPTAPDPADDSLWAEEPPPSLGGFAVCDSEWPVEGWRWCDEPVEWIEELSDQARASGEGVNLWRQHLLALDDGRMALFYNSGDYFQEQLYAKVAEKP